MLRKPHGERHATPERPERAMPQTEPGRSAPSLGGIGQTTPAMAAESVLRRLERASGELSRRYEDLEQARQQAWELLATELQEAVREARRDPR